MAAGNPTTKRVSVRAPTGTMLQVVYTNDERTLEDILAMYEECLATAKHRFVGLDLEYTPLIPHTKRHAVALVQIAMYKHVLLFHWCKSSQTQHGRDLLQNFFSNKGIEFASVDTTGDTKVLVQSGFTPPQKHIDIHSLVGSKIGMSTLAGEMIDTSYHEMKDNFPPLLHQRWDRMPLCKKSLEYAAVDGYVSYELYDRIQTMKDSIGRAWLDLLLPLCKKKEDGEGTSRSRSKRARG